MNKWIHVYLLHISLTQSEKEIVPLVGFFLKDTETDQQQERTEPKITYFFKKGGKKWKCLCKRKAQYGVVCDKILMKSTLLYWNLINNRPEKEGLAILFLNEIIKHRKRGPPSQEIIGFTGHF